MAEPTTLGLWLRRERERRGITLAKISEDTKVAVPLLVGLEGDDLSRWPGGIFRRSFIRSYATAVGLDPDVVLKRVDEEHPTEELAATTGARSDAKPVDTPHGQAPIAAQPRARSISGRTLRTRAALLDLLVAGAIGFGFAAAGSRLLWPVLLIAAYHALGVLLAGTTPMAALLAEPDAASPRPADAPAQPPQARRPEAEQRGRRSHRARRANRVEQQPTRH
jgi:transcriptional regulator with XRE-family HTH domain